MIRPERTDIGRRVVYRPRHDAKPEEGVITSYSMVWVFVRYGSDSHSKATLAQDLEWAAPRILPSLLPDPA